MKNVRIPSYSGPHFPAFGRNTFRITPNTGTFYAVKAKVFPRNHNVNVLFPQLQHIVQFDESGFYRKLIETLFNEEDVSIY